jgi:mRNA interferase RelE/StbE
MADTTYTIEYKRSVAKELRKLPPTQLKAIVSKIRALATNPHPEGSVKLRGSSDLFRVRHADYRVIYQVQDKKLTLLVIKVGHRGEIYREF